MWDGLAEKEVHHVKNVTMVLLWSTFCWTVLLNLVDLIEGTIDNANISQQGCMNEDEPFANFIPKDYKKHEAPSVKDGKPTDVYISLQIFDLFALNEETMDIKASMFFNDMWEDKRLQLNCLQLKKPLIIPQEVAKNLWFADIFFENSRSEFKYQLTQDNTVTKIMPGGALYHYARYGIKFSCPLDLHLYPMDVQKCHMNFALNAYSDDVVQLHWADAEGNPVPGIKAIELISPVMLPQYDLVAINTSGESVAWDTGNFTTLTASFTFARHLTAYLSNTYIPSFLVVILSWLSFWLDIDAVPARVTLGVTSLLTLATQVVQSRRSLPPIAYINALDVWNFVCVNIVFLTLVEYGIAYYNGYYRTTKYQVSKSTNVLFSKIQKSSLVQPTFIKKPDGAWTGLENGKNASFTSKPGTVTTINSPDTRDSSFIQKETPVIQRGPKKKNSQPIDKTSRILFPLFFLLFNIVYWSYYCAAV